MPNLQDNKKKYSYQMSMLSHLIERVGYVVEDTTWSLQYAPRHLTQVSSVFRQAYNISNQPITLAIILSTLGVVFLFRAASKRILRLLFPSSNKSKRPYSKDILDLLIAALFIASGIFVFLLSYKILMALEITLCAIDAAIGAKSLFMHTKLLWKKNPPAHLKQQIALDIFRIAKSLLLIGLVVVSFTPTPAAPIAQLILVGIAVAELGIFAYKHRQTIGKKISIAWQKMKNFISDTFFAAPKPQPIHAPNDYQAIQASLRPISSGAISSASSSSMQTKTNSNKSKNSSLSSFFYPISTSIALHLNREMTVNNIEKSESDTEYYVHRSATI